MAVTVQRDARGRVLVPPRPPGMRRRVLREPVHLMIAELSREWGKCFATEAGLRRELYRRTGYVCGVRSIGRVIAREVDRGEIGQERVRPYGRRVDGDRHHPGTTHTWVIVRREQRKSRRRLREEERQARHKAAREERERLELEQRAREIETREIVSRSQRGQSGPDLFAWDASHHGLGEGTDEAEASTSREDIRAHVRTALAAIEPVEPPTLRGPQKTDEQTISSHGLDLDARRAEVQRQRAELRAAGFDVPDPKPPDE